MPIRAENKHRYPDRADWLNVRSTILARADNRCEECGVENYALGGRNDGRWHAALPLGEKLLRLEWPEPGSTAWCSGYDGFPLRIIRIVLTIAHLDHQPENNDPTNLRALCQRCHLAYDREHHREQRARNRHRDAGQEDLF